MKTIFIKDLKRNQSIDSEAFVLAEFSIASDKNGKPYANIVLMDKTGSIQAKIWSESLAGMDSKSLIQGSIVRVNGKVDEYRGKLQCTVNSMIVIQEDKLDDFMPCSEYDCGEMMRELMAEIELVKRDDLRNVLKTMFEDEEFSTNYKYSPAGKSVHHDFRSGMLQHVLEMIEIAKSLQKYYRTVDYDILMAGIILHDTGKFYELLSNGIGTTYTKKGMLLGHISLGVLLFDKYANGKVDENTYYNIVHLILSHHGELQFGSPAVPATLEAVILSSIDRLSSKARAAQKAVSQIPDDQEAGMPVPWLEGARFFRTNAINAQTNLAQESEKPESSETDEDTGDILIFQE